MKPVYLVSLTLSLEDAAALWSAAAATAMAAPGMTIDDVVDTIGPREDPSIEDCIAMLAQPGRFSGCAVTAMECVRVGDVASTGRIDDGQAIEPAPARKREWRTSRLINPVHRMTPAAAR